MYKHILIPTDGSELAEKAVDHGLALAKHLGAKATILIATESWSAFRMAQLSVEGQQNPIANYQKLADAHAAKVLDSVVARAKEAGVAVESVHARDSHPAEAIVAEAKTRKCDLIVMASHARRGISQVMLGSQTAKVASLTDIPVLVYR